MQHSMLSRLAGQTWCEISFQLPWLSHTSRLSKSVFIIMYNNVPNSNRQLYNFRSKCVIQIGSGILDGKF